MLKKILLASAMTVAFSVPAMAQDAAAGCASCGVETGAASARAESKPIRLAQLGPVRGGSVEQAVRGPEQGNTRPLVTCCDPAAANLSWSNVFSWDETTGAIGSRYGVKFDPNSVPGLHAAMHNTAFIASVMNGTPGNSWLVMEGDVRTDNKDGGNWPSDPGAFAQTAPMRAIDAWNNTGGYGTSGSNPAFSTISTGWLGWWRTLSPSTLHSGVTLAFGQGATPVPHMRGDTTRYTMKTSLWLWYIAPGTHHWQRREVICNNVARKYFGWQRGGASFKMAGGSSISSASAPAGSENQRVSLGAPVPLTPDQIKQAETEFGKLQR